MYVDKSLSIDDICQTLKISRSTYYRYVARQYQVRKLNPNVAAMPQYRVHFGYSLSQCRVLTAHTPPLVYTLISVFKTDVSALGEIVMQPPSCEALLIDRSLVRILQTEAPSSRTLPDESTMP
jgi:hypothetical protein